MIFRSSAPVFLATWCCGLSSSICRKMSTVPATGTMLHRYRSYLLNKSREEDVDQEIKSLMTKNRLVVVKDHCSELSKLLTSATKKELPYLSYLLYKAYDKSLLMQLQSRLENTEDFKGLSLTDMRIICTTAFASNIRVQNPMLMHDLCQRLMKHISDRIVTSGTVVSDHSVTNGIVPIVKLLRKSKYYDTTTLRLLRTKLDTDQSHISLTTLTHCLAWIVDSEVFPSPISPNILGRIEAEIDADVGSEDVTIRNKDIDRIIWILSFQQDVPKALIAKLINLALHDDLSFSSLTLGNMLLNLSILGVYDEDLTKAVLDDGSKTEIGDAGVKDSRQLSRMGLFLEASIIEAQFSTTVQGMVEKLRKIVKKKMRGVMLMDRSLELNHKLGLSVLKRILETPIPLAGDQKRYCFLSLVDLDFILNGGFGPWVSKLKKQAD